MVRDHLHRSLELLDKRGFTNHVLVITRWHSQPGDIKCFERLWNLRPTIFVT